MFKLLHDSAYSTLLQSRRSCCELRYEQSATCTTSSAHDDISFTGCKSVLDREDVGPKLWFYAWKKFSGSAHGGRYVRLNGVDIYFETYGIGPPVLVIHEGLGSLDSMSHQVIAISKSHFVIAPDTRGHGRSGDFEAQLSYSLLARDMLKLLDHLGIGQVDVVGWSDGGIVGLELAVRHPERIKKLVVIGGNYDVDGLVEKPTIRIGTENPY